MKSSQELLLDLIESAGKWNAFDGPGIAEALHANRKLWRAVVLTDMGGEFRVSEEGVFVGIGPAVGVLGGLIEGQLMYDIIRAVPVAGQHAALQTMFEAMHPDSVRWLGLEETRDAFGRTSKEDFAAAGFSPDHAILEAWWD